MGIIEITTIPVANYGLREDGSAEDIYRDAYWHPWAIVKCANLIIEGKIESTDVDFFLVGYAEEAAVTFIPTVMIM